MRWLISDTLSCPEQYFCSHLDSYSHYLREAGETVQTMQVPHGRLDYDFGGDIIFALDGYQRMAFEPTRNRVKRIAQVAAITNPLPWDVRKADGSPAYDLVISSIPWMVEAAREKGCRAEFMPLAFDTRARVCEMVVNERDIDCLFIGTVGGNHVRRTKLLHELRDVVTVLPPVYGREYFKTLARAKVVINIHAEWSVGYANNMRLYEAAGLGCVVVSDGDHIGHVETKAPKWWLSPGDPDDPKHWREAIGKAMSRPYNEARASVLLWHTYETRIPSLIELARSI